MHMVVKQNPYVDGSGLTGLYKFAYGDELSEETITEVIGAVVGRYVEALQIYDKRTLI